MIVSTRAFAPAIFLLSAATAMVGCAANSRYEQALNRELSLHAYDEGVRFIETENYQVALDRFIRSAQISPRPAAYYQMGRLYEELGDPQEGSIAYMTALELAPDFQQARVALLALNYEPPTETEIKEDTEAWPAFSERLLGEVELRELEAEEQTGQLNEEEREALRQRIRARINLAAARRIPTQAEVQAVLFSGVGGEQEVPSATDPTYAGDREIILNTYHFHFSNGQRFQLNKEYEKAAAEYGLALQADPDQLEARTNWGDVMLRLERYPQAYFHYSTAQEMFPDSARPLLKLGIYYHSLERRDLAQSFYERALEKDPDYVEALNNLAAIEISDRAFDQAIDRLNSALQIDPSYAHAYLNLGIAHQNRGDQAASLEAYRRYVEFGGERSAEVRRWIAEIEVQ